MVQATGVTPRCGVCAGPLGDQVVACRLCETPIHADCYGYNGGCATYACPESGRRGVVRERAELLEYLLVLVLLGSTVGLAMRSTGSALHSPYDYHSSCAVSTVS